MMNHRPWYTNFLVLCASSCLRQSYLLFVSCSCSCSRLPSCGLWPLTTTVYRLGILLNRLIFCRRPVMSAGAEFLFDAIIRGDETAVSHLIDLYGSPILMEKDSNGFSCLHWCAASPDSERLVPTFVFYGAHIDSRDNLGNTPLHAFCARGCGYGVACLLSHKIDVNMQNDSDQDSALHIATRHKNVEIARLLLAFGAKSNVTNAAGESPIDLGLLDLLKAQAN